MNDDLEPSGDAQHVAARRAALKKLGRYAAVGPAVTLLLAAALKPKRVAAASAF